MRLRPPEVKASTEQLRKQLGQGVELIDVIRRRVARVSEQLESTCFDSAQLLHPAGTATVRQPESRKFTIHRVAPGAQHGAARRSTSSRRPCAHLSNAVRRMLPIRLLKEG